MLAAVKMPASPFEEKVEEIFDVSPKAEAMVFAVCAPNLTKERADKQFTLRVGEATYPSIILAATDQETSHTTLIEYRKIRSTKYELRLPTGLSYPATIIFPQRFDPWWELRGVPAQHIKVNGFANGWIVEREEDGLIYLEYQGERYTRVGIVLTAIVVILGGIYMGKKIRKRNT